MRERFQGRDGRVELLAALRKQFLVDGNAQISERIASAAVLNEYTPDTPLFRQGERGGELHLILLGQVSVHVDGHQVATVNAGMHVGEISLLEPFKRRSATVIAIDTVVAALVTLQRFEEIAKFHPELWRRIAIELAHRLVYSQTTG